MSIFRHSRFHGLGLVLLFCIFLEASSERALAQEITGANSCLILYDTNGEWGWIGNLHAEMLANLLGHFPLDYQIRPVEDYQAGDINNFRCVFYFGNTYDNPLPAAFLQDVMTTTNPVCWFQYNLWQFTESMTYGTAFEEKFGFTFDYLDSSGYTNINYKTEILTKDALDPELGLTTILDPNTAEAPAIAWQGSVSNAVPYIVHGSNFWYIADTPFSYIGEEDRYLVFADILHDIVQIPHAETHPALIRLEDIDPTYPTNLVRQAVDFLSGEGVPFGLSVIPMYADPLGVYNNGVGETIPLTNEPGLVTTLRYALGKGGQIVMHGYTHQYDTTINPYSGVSADDYEFFRVTVDANDEIVDYHPVAEDSAAWVQNRLQSGLALLAAAGLRPVAWETPHYAASAVDYPVFGKTFLLTSQRALYFDSLGHYAGQFFPYVIERDIYGQKILPENLGNIDPDSDPPRLPADMVRIARKMRVVRDGWASAFFHPYLDINYLRDLVHGIKGLGYTYVPFAIPPAIAFIPTNIVCKLGSSIAVTPELSGTSPFKFQWQYQGTNLSFATNSTLVLTNVQVAQSGAYRLIVSNSVTAITSAPVYLKVVVPFALSSRPDPEGFLSIEFLSQSNFSYRLEYASNLVNGSWTAKAPVSGTGSTITLKETNTEPKLFYRVRVE